MNEMDVIIISLLDNLIDREVLNVIRFFGYNHYVKDIRNKIIPF